MRDPQWPQTYLYETTDETQADIRRLILLQDFDGLQKRVVVLTKERLQCDQVLQSKDL